MNHKKASISISIIVLAGVLATGGSVHIALAHSSKVLENSQTDVQTHANQRQDCETTGGISSMSDSCAGSSKDTITQSGGDTTTEATAAKTGTTPPPPILHPTSLTLEVLNIRNSPSVVLIGFLKDLVTSSGVGGADITFTGLPSPTDGQTDANGVVTIQHRLPPGTYTVQAHFAGAPGLGPSDSTTQTFTK